ncbi:MAG: hypothetical protein ACYTG0_41540 [Planctomycetota bacterium]|jgi:hypothetical protein
MTITIRPECGDPVPDSTGAHRLPSRTSDVAKIPWPYSRIQIVSLLLSPMVPHSVHGMLINAA